MTTAIKSPVAVDAATLAAARELVEGTGLVVLASPRFVEGWQQELFCS
jgi:hypothetical protein